MRTNGEYRRLLHLRSMGNDTDPRIEKKHSRRKPYKSRCGASLPACNPQSILAAEKNRRCRLLRQRNELQSLEILKTSAGLVRPEQTWFASLLQRTANLPALNLSPGDRSRDPPFRSILLISGRKVLWIRNQGSKFYFVESAARPNRYLRNALTGKDDSL